MRRSDKLKEIFVEVRRALGQEAGAGEVLRISYAILESYAEYQIELATITEERPYRGFLVLAVDEAMRDGGWRILLRDPTFKWDPDS